MADEVVHVVQERLSLGKVGVPQQVNVEVGDRDGVDSWRNGVGGVVAGPRRRMQFCGEMDRQVDT